MSQFRVSRVAGVAPYAVSLAYAPLLMLTVWLGGWWFLLIPLYGLILFPVVDLFAGLNMSNPETEEDDSYLFWYRVLTITWAPTQAILVIFSLWVVGQTVWLNPMEQFLFFGCLGVITGAIGINYAHEMMHQKPWFERLLGDFLLTMVLYGHVRTEHILVHHRYVGTPRDVVTARYNVGAYRALAEVLVFTVTSAFRTERARLAHKGLPWWHRSNPFWRYVTWEVGWLALAFLIAGWWGVALFVLQAFVAIIHLEFVNYVEHYGLTRRHMGNGKYEHIQPHHSWNASHLATNWVLINLQRHSDHHYKPSRRYPVLQTYAPDKAPQLPFGYPFMIFVAMVPPLWRRQMNPRVQAWRQKYYPDIDDWEPYNKGLTPLPR